MPSCTFCWAKAQLNLKASITTAADDKFCEIFPNFRKKLCMIFHENRLPDDSHGSMPYLLFLKKQ